MAETGAEAAAGFHGVPPTGQALLYTACVLVLSIEFCRQEYCSG